MKYTITPLGGMGRAVRAIAGAVVEYLLPGRSQRPPATAEPFSQPEQSEGPAHYYADSGDSGRWSGRGAGALGLRGDVQAVDFARVLAGRHPRTGARLITAQGSAGRRPKLGVGSETRQDADGRPLYDARDAAAALGLPVRQLERMLQVGTMLALARLFELPVAAQPDGSYLVPVLNPGGEVSVGDDERARCEEALEVGTTPAAVEATGPESDLLPMAEAARLAGVTPRYLRRLAKRYETDRESIERAVAAGRTVRHAYLVASRGTKDRWFVTRGELAGFLDRRRQPAIRVGFDATLTTEKSLGVLGLLSTGATRRAVLSAIQAGNNRALAWWEDRAAIARAAGKVVPAQGWTVASFEHHTSRALDPFPHVHNVVANTVEDAEGVRRALDARGLYRHARAASALATTEMRYQLTRRLGVRWRPAARGAGWEIAGIPDEVLREFSRRAGEIEDALRELEEIIGRGARPDEIDHVKVTTRPSKMRIPIDELLEDWWGRAERLGFDSDDLAACLTGPAEPPEPDPDALYEALAAPDGICANLSIFNRADVLAALVNLPVQPAEGDDPQPPIVSAARLELLADGFLASRHVEPLTPGTPDGAPDRYTTREMLGVQDRVVARYRRGRHQGAGHVAPDLIDAALTHSPTLTEEQRHLVHAFCRSGHRIQCAIGHPGAGKTTAMATARHAWTAAGWRVLGAAVKGEAARTLATTAGIPTETLAWHLAHDDPLHSPLDARTVLVVDEASTISDRDLDKLAWLAEHTGATLRLIGDPAQHGAVEAGGMFRVLCEQHLDDTPELTHGHRLRNPHDRAAAEHLRAGDITGALDALDAAGHLHVIDDDIDAYTDVLARWWDAHRAGHTHPMVNRRNDVRRALNHLAHQLRRAAGELNADEIASTDDRRYSVGDRVIARRPNRDLHPPDRPDAYVRNGATGTITHLHPAAAPDDDAITVNFDDLGPVTLPRSFIDEHELDGTGPREVGLDHAYAVTSYAVTGATYTVSTSRIDETSSRAETYVDITRGRDANHLYLTRPNDDLDGERLPRPPPDPVEEAIADRLTRSDGERTAWELREDQRNRAVGPDDALALP